MQMGRTKGIRMFQTISLIGLIATLILVVRVCLDLNREHLLKAVATRGFGAIKLLVAAMTVLAAVILALSGFGGSLMAGRDLSGYLLMGHTAAGGGFIVCLALTAVLWAEECKMGACDIENKSSGIYGRWTAGRRFFFWSFLAFGLCVAVSIFVSMLPLFPSEYLHVLKDVHRWCGLLLILSGLGFSFSK